jgi:Lon protease-like protein
VTEEIERFPLFPLGLVLLPSEVVPLHIFEERYKLMIGECVEQGREFGIVWLSDDGLKEVGCTAAVTQVLERDEEGRMNILVQGGRPFRLLRRIEDMPYPAGDVDLLEDPEDDEIDPEVAAGARERYADLVARVTDSRPDESDLTALDSYEMAATIDFTPDAKQDLLEVRSEEERLRLVAEMFGAAMKRLDYIEEASEQARSNGRARFQSG